MNLDIGMYHVGTVHFGPAKKKFFTVEDENGDVSVYEHPYGESKKAIRIAIAVAFIDEAPYPLESEYGEYRVTGRYPNYRIEEVTP